MFEFLLERLFADVKFLFSVPLLPKRDEMEENIVYEPHFLLTVGWAAHKIKNLSDHLGLPAAAVAAAAGDSNAGPCSWTGKRAKFSI